MAALGEQAVGASEEEGTPALQHSSSPREQAFEQPTLLATRSLPQIPGLEEQKNIRATMTDGKGETPNGSLLSRMRQSLTFPGSFFRKHLSDASSGAARHREDGFMAKLVTSAVGIRPSFYWNKAVMSEEERMLAVLSAKSLKSDSQDEVCLTTSFAGNEGCVFVGVFDGHGPEGRAAAKFAGRYVQQALQKDRRIFSSDSRKKFLALKEACYSCQKKMADYRQSGFDAYFSGTTAVFAVLLHGVLHIANCGDSRAIVCKVSKDNMVEAVALTEDAKPEMPSESTRIYRRGGVVAQMSDGNGNPIGPHRVYKRGTEYPGLAMSRSLGDLTAHHVGVIAKPERVSYSLGPEDHFVVFASDGVWQVMSNQEVAEFVYSYMNARDDNHNCADALTLHAQDMWKSQMDEVIVDDIGVVILHFKELPPARIKRAMHHNNPAASTNDQANQMYRKWERSPHLDPGLIMDHMHFQYLQSESVKAMSSPSKKKEVGEPSGDRMRPVSSASQSDGVEHVNARVASGAHAEGREGELTGSGVMEPSSKATNGELSRAQSGFLEDARSRASLDKLAALSGDVVVPKSELSKDSKLTRVSRSGNPPSFTGGNQDRGRMASAKRLAKSITGKSNKVPSPDGSSEGNPEPGQGTDAISRRRSHGLTAGKPSVDRQDSRAEVDTELYFHTHDVEFWLSTSKVIAESLHDAQLPEGLFLSPDDADVDTADENSAHQTTSNQQGKQAVRFWSLGNSGQQMPTANQLMVEPTESMTQHRLTASLLSMHNDILNQLDKKNAAS